MGIKPSLRKKILAERALFNRDKLWAENKLIVENTKLVNFYHTPIVRSNKNNKNNNNVPISANFNLSTTPEHFSQKLDLTRKSSVKSPAEMNNNINNTNIGDSIQNIQNTSEE